MRNYVPRRPKVGIYRMSAGRFFFPFLFAVVFIGLAALILFTEEGDEFECRGTTGVYTDYAYTNNYRGDLVSTREIYTIPNDPACTDATGYNIPPFSGTDR